MPSYNAVDLDEVSSLPRYCFLYALDCVLFFCFFLLRFCFFQTAHVERESCILLLFLLFCQHCAMKPATGYSRMPKKPWTSHADLFFLNGTELFFFFGTGLVQPDKETNKKSKKYITFWPPASGEYGPLFESKRQIFDVLHWPNLCVSHVYAAENRSPRTFLDHRANSRTCFSGSRDDPFTARPYDCTAGPERSTRGLERDAQFDFDCEPKLAEAGSDNWPYL